MPNIRNRVALSAALCLFTAACSTVKGPYVWVDTFRENAAPVEQVIKPGDLLSVRVREDEKLSTPRVRVRDDGRIALDLINEVEVGSHSTNQAARRIEDRLRADKVLTNPHVLVIIEETRAATISVIGSVARPGTYPLSAGSGVAEALASAGSLTEFAHRDRIFVVRRIPELTRIRFTYDGLTGQKGAASLFRLRAGDVVVVE